MNSRSGRTTTTALLESLKDPGRDAVWREFDARYRPVLASFGLKLGLTPGEAEEIAQQTLTEFVREYRAGKYDRSRGRLSSWILGIARNLISDRRQSGAKRKGWRGESAMVDLGNRTRLTQVWEEERRRAILARAMETLRAGGRTADDTLRAFELVAVRGVPPEEAARECGMSVDEVYVAKNRVTKRLRQIVEELTASYSEA